MSLNWDITDINNYEELMSVWDDERDCQTNSEWTKTDSLIWLCMSVDLRGITEKNYLDFYGRVCVVDAAVGVSMRIKGEDYKLTLQDIQRRIGLSTNVTDHSLTKFLKKAESVCELNVKALKAIYDKAIKEAQEESITHIERNESFAFDLQARSGA